jgi:Short-chain dehydrogenases of various substrate specificities
MAVNFFAPVYLATAALPHMLERRRGAVINVTSVAGYVPNPGESAYGAAKAALSLWTHGLAVDLHDTGVQATVVSPGPIDTEIWSLDEELSYAGKLYPPQVVADAVADAVEKGWVHRTVPRRYGLVGGPLPGAGPADALGPAPLRSRRRQEARRHHERRKPRVLAYRDAQSVKRLIGRNPSRS